MLAVFWHCTEDNPIQPEPTFVPEISNLIYPAVVYSLSPQKHIISVKVVDPQGIDDIEEVFFEVTKVDSSSPNMQGLLHDNGVLGDILPIDGIYATQIDGSFAQNDFGQFNLEVIARDASGNASNVLTAFINVLSIAPGSAPVILRTIVPSSVIVIPDFEFLIEVEVADSDGLSDIKRVFYQLAPPAHPNPTVEAEFVDDGSSGDKVPGDGIFTAVLSTRLFTKISDYFLRFQAQDLGGNASQPVVVIVKGRAELLFEPIISKTEAPRIVILDGVANPEVAVSVEVTDPQGFSNIEYVRYKVILPDSSAESNDFFQMADDGNVAVSGDTIAGDGRYSGKFTFITNEMTPGEFRFVFQVMDKNNFLSNKIEYSIIFTFNSAPVILNLSALNEVSIVDKRDSVIVNTIDVADAQGLSDIEYVKYRVVLPGDEEDPNGPYQMADDGDIEISGDAIAGDGTYSNKFGFEAENVVAGDYKFIFQAKDKNDSLSNVIEHSLTLSFINSPVLSNVVAPDTVKLHPTNQILIDIMVDVKDPEGFSNIDWVRFKSFLPNGDESSQSPFYLVDDGSSGDDTAGDGTYSLTIVLLPRNAVPPVPLGNFRFVFQAKDKSALFSNIIENILTVTE